MIAAGGLRLLAGSRRRARWVLAGVFVWALADAALLFAADAAARSQTSAGSAATAAVGWSAGFAVWVIAAAVVVGAGALALRGRDAGWRPSPVGSLVYSGASFGVALLLPFGLTGSVLAATPAWLTPTVGAFAALLIGTAVISAWSGGRSGARTAGVALATVALGAAAVAGRLWWRPQPESPDQVDPMWLLEIGVLAALGAGVIALAWLCGVWPAVGARRANTIAVLAPLGGGAVFVASLWFALGVNGELYRVLPLFTTATGPFATFDDGAVPWTLVGLLVGAALGLVMLAPQALSTPDIFGGPDVVTEPDPGPKPEPPRAPVAAPGVPEILEHPQPTASRS